ncbi:MAG TPA: DUF2141 domain-containing protein, partial [Arenibaculum sp.]|nr:DUF2141 domain-containing protein [Arenibaculum sp.]
VPAGRYGIAVLHDLDGDGALDRTVFGMPTEPFGFSNDAFGFMGPPEFDAMAFEVTDPVTKIALTLRR